MVSNNKLEVTVYRCPDCNTKLEPEQAECEYCGSVLSWNKKKTGLHVRIDITDDRTKTMDEESDKPIAYITNENGNVLSTLSICRRALSKIGRDSEADEMKGRVFESESWDEAISIMNEYVILA